MAGVTDASIFSSKKAKIMDRLKANWLPVRERIAYKLCSLMHGIVHGHAPNYLTDMVVPVADLAGRCHLRAAQDGLFDIPRSRTAFGSRAFLLLDHKPGINYLLTFETLPHTRLLNTILKRSYLILRTDFRYHHTIFVRFYC